MSLSRCSQLTVLGFGFSRSRSLGGGKVGHSSMMWWTVCSSAPHGQAADGRRPQRCILALNRPTPVRSRFSVAQSLRGRSAPGGRLVFGVTESWGVGGGGGVGESAASWFSMLEACWNRSHSYIYRVAQINGMVYFQHYEDAITGIIVWSNFSWEKWYQDQQFLVQ